MSTDQISPSRPADFSAPRRRRGWRRCLVRARRWLRRPIRWWAGLKPHWKRHWIINIAIGVLIEVLLATFRHEPIPAGFENLASDLSMRVHSGFASADHPPLRMGLIDVDEETWRSSTWGHGPYFAPRLEVFDLLKFAASQKPRFIVLDISIEAPEVKADALLPVKLNSLPKEIDYIFVRSIRRSPYSIHEEASKLLTDQIQPSPLDAFIASHDNFHIAAPYFLTSRDDVVRGWRLWRLGCRTGGEQAHSGQLEIVPSVQLAIAALLKPGSIAHARQALNQAVALKQPCATDFDGLGAQALADPDIGARARQSMAERRIADAGFLKGLEPVDRAEGEDPQSRILFRYGVDRRSSAIATLSALTALDGATSTGRQARADFTRQVQGGVVLIGQSFDAAGDIHSTPLGAMPGGMIILNAVASALHPGVIQEPWRPLEFGVDLISIVAVGYAFARTKAVVANALAVIGALLLVVPLSLILLELGYWLDFAAPLIAIAIHRAFAEIEEYANNDRRLPANHAAPPKHSGD